MVSQVVAITQPDELRPETLAVETRDELAARRNAFSALQAKLEVPTDMASLALLRMGLGALLCVSTLRFMANGWVERFFVTPTYFFPYYGFEWVTPLSPTGMWLLHGTMAAAAALVAIGLFYRAAIVILFLSFTYVELIDVTNYLNHYYLVTLLLLVFCFLPLSGMWSLDAQWFPGVRRQTLPAWCVGLVRAQIAIVYIGAGLAKANSDWLFHAQPLGIWLAARQETVLLGPLLTLPWAPLVFSWAGFLHDLLAPFALMSRRCRWLAYPVIVAFHVGTHLLFNIGIFPVLMPIFATIFFRPRWPRDAARFVGRLTTRRDAAREPTRPAVQAPAHDPPWRFRRLLLPAVACYLALQLALPLRAHLYPGNVLWAEQGMRYSWRVMVREKSGAIMYRVRTREWSREKQVPPSRYLTSHQEREFSGQPDMIARLAQRIAEDYRARGLHDVEVRADAWVSLNGRPNHRLIDPDADLSKVTLGWVPPTGSPPALKPHRSQLGGWVLSAPVKLPKGAR